jgi:hypothetical protein
MAADSPDDADLEALRLAREEARATLDDQLSTIDDVDSKALSVFQLDVTIVGVLLSALSFAAATDAAAVSALLNPGVGAAAGLFVLSAAAAGLTYTTAPQRVGAGPDGLERATELSERAYLRWLVGGYAEWIRSNERTNVRKALLVTLSALGTVAGALALGVGVVAAFFGVLLLPALGALAVLLVLAALAGVPGQLRRLFTGRHTTGATGGTAAPQSLDTPMTGQRTFKGCDQGD